MPKPKSVVGWCLVAGGVLLEAFEHVDFISSHLPRQLATLINEPLILVVIVIGFGFVLIATRESRSESSTNASEPVNVVPAAVPALRPARHLSHNMQFTGAKYVQSTNGGPGIVIACFQNKPIPHTPLKTFRFGRVTVTFSHESGEAIGEVSPAAWADADVPTVDFEAGVTHCAVVAAFTQGQWGVCRMASQETYWGDTAYSIEHPPLPTGILKVTVILIGEMNVSLPAAHLTLTLPPNGAATVKVD